MAGEPFKIEEDEQFLEEVRREFGSERVWDDIRRLIELDMAKAPHEFPMFPNTRFHFAALVTKPQRILIFEVDGINQVIFYRGVRRSGGDN